MKITGEFLRSNSITRRSFIIMSGQAGLLSLLASKMLYMQVVDAKKYRILSDKNRINLVMLPPLRGEILDRNGKILATNHSAFRVILSKTENLQYKDAVNHLATLLQLDEDDRKALLKTANKILKKQPSPLFDNLSWEQVSIIEENIASLPGIYIDKGQYRKYNFPEYISHPIGYISMLNKQDKEEFELENISDFQIGKAGLEKSYEETVQGSFGTQEVEVNAHGMLVREISSTPSISGSNLQTNLDIDLQIAAMKALPPKGGSATILDLHDGKVIAMASTPGFDSNQFVGGVSHDYWNQILNDPYKPLINRTIQNNYPPGSIFKMITVLAALEYGMDPNVKINCTGASVLGDNHFRCWYRPGHGNLDMAHAIEHSCNSYMFHIAKTIGAEKIAATARKFGLGDVTGIDIPSESAGLIPDPAWKKARFKEAWRLGDSLNTSIGQGFVLATPLQLATLCGSMASGGKLFTPRLVGKADIAQIDIAKEHLDFIKNGMVNVLNSSSGTAYAHRIDNPDWMIAGKTGTAQVRSKVGETNLSISGAWELRNHALFIGYAPVHDPRYAISVVVDHGGGGGSTAAPVAKQLFLEIMKRG